MTRSSIQLAILLGFLMRLMSTDASDPDTNQTYFCSYSGEEGDAYIVDMNSDLGEFANAEYPHKSGPGIGCLWQIVEGSAIVELTCDYELPTHEECNEKTLDRIEITLWSGEKHVYCNQGNFSQPAKMYRLVSDENGEGSAVYCQITPLQ